MALALSYPAASLSVPSPMPLSVTVSGSASSTSSLSSERAHQITALELQRALHKRRHRDVQGHALVLASCYRKIKRVAAVDSTSCIFEVPEFVIGAPPFELSTAVSYVISSLERNGYMVAYMFPRALLISWDLEGVRSRPTEKMVAKTLGQETVALDAHSSTPMFDVGHSSHTPPLLPSIAPRTTGYKSIADFKPAGRFVMRI